MNRNDVLDIVATLDEQVDDFYDKCIDLVEGGFRNLREQITNFLLELYDRMESEERDQEKKEKQKNSQEG